ncbi:MAG: TRAP transporter small permease subunit [Alphaproteobacteria bacterium]|nr:MAG: TRAP transporter small permease subunit [Alphaproteobacteria bacterium]
MRLLDQLCNALAALAGVYLAGTMAAIVFQATARSLGLSGSSHVFTFTEYGLLWIAMAASPWLVRIRGHVFIELFSAFLPLRFVRAWSRIVAAICVIVCLFLTWYSTQATLHAWERGDADMRSLDMPKWLLLGSMPICFGLMALNFLRFVFGRETLHTGQPGVHE